MRTLARNRVRLGKAMGPRRTPRTWSLTLITLCILLFLYALWPYVTLWRIDQALSSDDPGDFADLVDLESVRMEITRRLNKEAGSVIGELSDSFIRWLEAGISVMGNQAVEHLVTLDWVRDRLAGKGGDEQGAGFLSRVTYAFFDAPDRFVVRVASTGKDPVWVTLSLKGLSWRISALYY